MITVAALIGAASAAAAEAPAPEVATAPGPCGVRVLQAPGQLAGSIEGRLAALAACGARLEVWVVRAVDGLFVTARDAAGRVRTRQVPDADVAAALLASWVAMDRAASPVVAGGGDDTGATGVGAEIGARPRPVIAGVHDLDHAAGAAPPLTLGFGGFVGATTSGMLRTGAAVDRDLWHHEGMSLAALVVVTRDVSTGPAVELVAEGFFRETGRWGGAALGLLHRRFGTGRVRVTPSVAFGAGVARHEVVAAADDGAGGAIAVEGVEVTLGFRVSASIAVGVRVASSVDLELIGGWMLSSYDARNGVDPADHAVTAGVAVRHAR